MQTIPITVLTFIFLWQLLFFVPECSELAMNSNEIHGDSKGLQADNAFPSTYSDESTIIDIIDSFSKEKENIIQNYSDFDSNPDRFADFNFTRFSDYYSKGVQFNYPSNWHLVENNSSLFVFSPTQIVNRSTGDLIFHSQNLSLFFNLSTHKSLELDSLRENGYTILVNGSDDIRNSSWIQYAKENLLFKQFYDVKDNRLHKSIAIFNKSIPINDSIVNYILSSRDFNTIKSYSNSQFGFSVDHPSDWKIFKLGNLIYFQSPLTQEYVAIGFPDYRHKLTLSSLTKNVFSNFMSNLKLHSASEIKLNSNEGFLIESSDITTGEPAITKLFLFDRKPYFVTLYSANNKSSIENEKILDGFLDSLRVLPPNNTSEEPLIKTGNIPVSFEIDEDRRLAYIANFHSNTVSVWDMKKNKIVSNITVGIRPNDAVFSPFTNQLYVANLGEGTVSVIDTFTNKVIKTIPLPGNPARLSIDYDDLDRIVFVSVPENNSIIPISEESLETFPPIKVGKSPWILDINPYTDTLYVASNNTAIDVIKYTSLLSWKFDPKRHSIDLSNYCNEAPSTLTVDHNMNKVYVGCNYINIPFNLTFAGQLLVIDGITNKIERITKIPPFPNEMDVDPLSHNLIFTNHRSNNITIIDTEKYNSTIIPLTESELVSYISIDPITSIAYVIRSYSNSIAAINMSSGSFELLAGVNFYVPNNQTNRIFCGTIMMEGEIKDPKPYGNGDFLMVENGTKLFCEPSDSSNFDYWSSTFLENDIPKASTDDFVSFFVRLGSFFGINFEAKAIAKPLIPLNVTSFGDLTAHYKEGSVFTPEDLDKFFYSFIVAAIIGPAMGWLLTVFHSNRERKRQLKYLRAFIPIIDDIYIQNNMDQGKCLDLLEQQRKEIISLLQSGILNDVTFRLLNSRIGDYIRKVSLKK